MSNLIVPNDAKKNNMDRIVKSAPVVLHPSKLRLFKVLMILGPTTTRAALLANEADFTGYPAGGGAMATPVIAGALDVDNRAVCTWDAITFTKNGATGNDIFGYWAEDSLGNLLWCESFDASIPLQTNGAFVTITPRFTNKSQFTNV
jgi:hypothetical protein